MLSFNRSVTGGFNLRSRGAGSLDSISLQADTLPDVFHAYTSPVHVYTACGVHKLDVTIRIQAARWYVFQCMYSRALPTQVCAAKCVYLVNTWWIVMGAWTVMRARAVYSQGLSLTPHMGWIIGLSNTIRNNLSLSWTLDSMTNLGLDQVDRVDARTVDFSLTFKLDRGIFDERYKACSTSDKSCTYLNIRGCYIVMAVVLSFARYDICFGLVNIWHAVYE